MPSRHRRHNAEGTRSATPRHSATTPFRVTLRFGLLPQPNPAKYRKYSSGWASGSARTETRLKGRFVGGRERISFNPYPIPPSHALTYYAGYTRARVISTATRLPGSTFFNKLLRLGNCAPKEPTPSRDAMILTRSPSAHMRSTVATP